MNLDTNVINYIKNEYLKSCSPISPFIHTSTTLVDASYRPPMELILTPEQLKEHNELNEEDEQSLRTPPTANTSSDDHLENYCPEYQ